ncbi:hypothetical protein DDE82_004825 [Stemphylium lycopersici]|uniref:Uncharacterized protein n=1 Tax=Stemphylium lycopersici TaxID=183478 RepID=A0A364N9K8_STELY|nr:hypothetical protein TW65_05050 [Stemphylium lycopersici]RAR03946.1 hypothetical protein DDE82_004825 [Stemphylium lycopersici]RAR13877.1 hypothetical protein DDE83_002766 [Stemphylium lycopersici]
MSDYEDEYDDYDVEFFYVEDEYMAADDLAEHAVASPPPATCGDEDMEDDWDRFDYYNDLEYASDGYDDTKFQAHDVKGAKAGLKRKRPASSHPRKKKATQTDSSEHVEPSAPAHSPIVWRSQADRGLQPKMLEDNAQPYALFKNWREKLADTPHWARGSPPNPPDPPSSRSDTDDGKTAFITEPASPPYDNEEDDDNDDDDDAMDDEGGAISQEALLAALQRQLAAAGGPLSGMDPQQLLEFATRMATDKHAGDDIAGEMADAILGEDEEDAEADEKLLSWVAQQRNSNTQPAEAEAEHKPTEQPPTPPPSNPNRSVRASQTSTASSVPTPTDPPAQPKTTKSSLKRKADTDPAGDGATKVVKKRTTRSFDAPTAASQAKAAPSKPVTRSRAARRG